MKETLSISAFAATFVLTMGGMQPQTTLGAAGGIAVGTSHFATLDTNKVHYVTVGQGDRTVLFVHGWASNIGFWREQVPALVGKARLILIDLPGHGQSDKPHIEYTPDFFARAVLAVLEQARADKATLVGHSMGTLVICRAYAQAPDKVAALVAVDGLLRRPTMTPEQVERFVGPYRTPGYREHATRFVKAMFPNPATATLQERVLSEMLATPQHVMLSAMAKMVDATQPAWDLPKVEVPVLVLNAPNRNWTPEYEAYVRSLSPKTDYRVIEGVGHFLMLEKPAEFNAALLEMLQTFDLIGK